MEDKNILVPLGGERMRKGGAEWVCAWRWNKDVRALLLFVLCVSQIAAASFWAKLPGAIWQKVQITRWRQPLQTPCCEVKSKNISHISSSLTPSLRDSSSSFCSSCQAFCKCVDSGAWKSGDHDNRTKTKDETSYCRNSQTFDLLWPQKKRLLTLNWASLY